jgi:phosphoribosylaminoimidazole-succinocarboxamide synthase
MPMTATITNDYTVPIYNALSYCLNETHLPVGKKYQGKVRDTYDVGDKLILITTDRQSAFDRVLASVPYKGQVLNLISAWWFEKTEHIIQNHLLAVPDPNVTIAKKCRVFPIEFIVRGYITGTTNTALWTQYKNGVRLYCGNPLPEGLVKNQRLEKPLLTPTTKEAHHDRPISPEEIIAEGWLSEKEWETASSAAMRLYEYGVEAAEKQGLILVDTKYEFGKDADGNIVLIDEVHTPDSSRYWIKDSYAERFAKNQEPDNIDKEFLRLWFAEHCDPYHDKVLPEAPKDLIVTLSSRYIQLYEMITGHTFHFPDKMMAVHDRVMRNIAGYLI